MGANDEVAATYHVGEHTPPTAFYVELNIDLDGNVKQTNGTSFYSWIENVRAEAKAEGMREAIKSVRWVYDLQCPVKPADIYIHRAAQIAHKWWEKVLGGRLDELECRANQYKEQQ